MRNRNRCRCSAPTGRGKMKPMNHYGKLAHDHWAQWLPTRFHQIENPDRFFTGLGSEVAEQIEATMEATTIPANVPADQTAGWWTMARLNATNQALAEMVFLPPEAGLEEEELPLDRYNPVNLNHQIMMEIIEDQRELEYQEQLALDAEIAAEKLTDQPH